MISIHAPREGSDLINIVLRPVILISIHAPREGSDEYSTGATCASTKFQSTLPARGATVYAPIEPWAMLISIHAPREGSDPSPPRAGKRPGKFQSTLPARGATAYNVVVPAVSVPFQSTLPARGATQLAIIRRQLAEISIHAPREGSDVTNNYYWR